MKKQLFLCLVWLVFGSMAGLVNAETPVAASQSTDEALWNKENMTTKSPDQYFESLGAQQYFTGNYSQALKSFKSAARYADKVSQLSIGLMYLNGQGVQKDPVIAYGWIAIAAERKYPQYLATRDQIWAQLDTQQRKQAKALVEELYPEYGDATAKSRLTIALRHASPRQSVVPPCSACQPNWVGPTNPVNTSERAWSTYAGMRI